MRVSLSTDSLSRLETDDDVEREFGSVLWSNGMRVVGIFTLKGGNSCNASGAGGGLNSPGEEDEGCGGGEGEAWICEGSDLERLGTATRGGRSIGDLGYMGVSK